MQLPVKRSLSLLFSMSFLSVFSQMKTYVFENALSYKIKDDFYSNYLYILSTPDETAHLFIVATPTGNVATLKIDDRLYAVYSEDGKVFKIDPDETLDRKRDKNNTDPNLYSGEQKNRIQITKTDKKETFKSGKCDVYTIDNKESICINTSSKINTVPFLLPAVPNLKGLLYRIGSKIELYNKGSLADLEKEEAQNDETDISKDSIVEKQNNIIIQFDENEEIDRYKRQLKKQ